MRPHGTGKKCQGAYKISLYRLFFALALTIALILCTLTGWFLNRQSRSDYYHYLEQSAVSQKNISSLSVNVRHALAEAPTGENAPSSAACRSVWWMRTEKPSSATSTCSL